MRSILLVLIGLVASPLTALAAPDGNLVSLLDIQFRFGALAGTVPLKLELNAMDHNSIEYVVLDMPWVFERIGALDRYYSFERLKAGELITPDIRGFDGEKIKAIAFQAPGGFDSKMGGSVNFQFRASKSAGGGCRVAALTLHSQGDWDQDGFANYGLTRKGSKLWLSGLSVGLESEAGTFVVGTLNLIENGQTVSVPLSSLSKGECP